MMTSFGHTRKMKRLHPKPVNLTSSFNKAQRTHYPKNLIHFPLISPYQICTFSPSLHINDINFHLGLELVDYEHALEIPRGASKCQSNKVILRSIVPRSQAAGGRFALLRGRMISDRRRGIPGAGCVVKLRGSGNTC